MVDHACWVPMWQYTLTVPTYNKQSQCYHTTHTRTHTLNTHSTHILMLPYVQHAAYSNLSQHNLICHGFFSGYKLLFGACFMYFGQSHILHGSFALCTRYWSLRGTNCVCFLYLWNTWNSNLVTVRLSIEISCEMIVTCPFSSMDCYDPAPKKTTKLDADCIQWRRFSNGRFFEWNRLTVGPIEM